MRGAKSEDDRTNRAVHQRRRCETVTEYLSLAASRKHAGNGGSKARWLGGSAARYTFTHCYTQPIRRDRLIPLIEIYMYAPPAQTICHVALRRSLSKENILVMDENQAIFALYLSLC